MSPLSNKLLKCSHVCEIKLCHPTTWKEYCLLKGELSETQGECESCKHFVIMEFSLENPLAITNVSGEYRTSVLALPAMSVKGLSPVFPPNL